MVEIFGLFCRRIAGLGCCRRQVELTSLDDKRITDAYHLEPPTDFGGHRG